MVEIKPDEISAILRQQLSNFNASADLEEVGTVLQVGDGIARVYGLNNVSSGELVEFENSTRAIALVPFSNSTSSPLLTLLRPYTRAIPSPTCNTVPTSSRSAEALKLLNC